ncbi:MAG: Rieske 2Fe-2S domain-containing protein [Deltaproteobacteria bacterium]|nr:Rieske 2Fe-2S domain-containing protein [Deltaproteobacteria bacterium]
MSIWRKILGICDTKPPADPGCWSWEGGRVIIDLDRAGELDQPGGGLRLEGGGLPQRVLVVRDEDGRFHAFHNRCTHAGRRLDPLPGGGQVRCCSVGQSVFDDTGQPLSGSAKKTLQVFPVEQDGRRLMVKPTVG